MIALPRERFFGEASRELFRGLFREFLCPKKLPKSSLESSVRFYLGGFNIVPRNLHKCKRPCAKTHNPESPRKTVDGRYVEYLPTYKKLFPVKRACSGDLGDHAGTSGEHLGTTWRQVEDHLRTTEGHLEATASSLYKK